MQSTPQRLHPLFDETSLYRLATRDSVWADGGEESIRSFFVARARADLRREWTERAPAKQNWNFGEPLNSEIHELLKKNQRPRDYTLRIRGFVQAPPARPKEPAPALLTFRADDRPVPRQGLFTGVGEVAPGKKISEFQVDIDDLGDADLGIVMIFTRDMVERLAAILSKTVGSEDVATEASAEQSQEDVALDVLGKALSAETLAPTEASAEQSQKAFRVSTLLALAPTLVGEIRDGRFQAHVDLGQECPALEPWTWLVGCFGREAVPTARSN